VAVKFIPSEIVPVIHADLIQRYGGTFGIRDEKLLDSSLAQAKARWGGLYLHKSIFDKAAAYGFHLCRNHPFVDGNKRTALIVMDIFLQKNGWELIASEEDTYTMIMRLADGGISKIELSFWLKENCRRLKK
jgi:death-on-curing protein